MGYLMSGKLSELDRLQLQARVWSRPVSASCANRATAPASACSTSAAGASAGSGCSPAGSARAAAASAPTSRSGCSPLPSPWSRAIGSPTSNCYATTYLRLPLQFASSLRRQLLTLVQAETLDELIAAAEGELAEPTRWGLTFTLVQTWATAL
jgi:hypothetical protein